MNPINSTNIFPNNAPVSKPQSNAREIFAEQMARALRKNDNIAAPINSKTSSVEETFSRAQEAQVQKPIKPNETPRLGMVLDIKV